MSVSQNYKAPVSATRPQTRKMFVLSSGSVKMEKWVLLEFCASLPNSAQVIHPFLHNQHQKNIQQQGVLILRKQHFLVLSLAQEIHQPINPTFHHKTFQNHGR